MDFFQNMQYEDAITYLLAAQKTDSLNLQTLGYLGYAYYMDDEAIAQYDTAYYLFKNPLMLYDCGLILDGSLKNNEAAKKYYAKYILLAKPESTDEKKAYEYIRRKYGRN